MDPSNVAELQMIELRFTQQHFRLTCHVHWP
jgi:hypothetical protein